MVFGESHIHFIGIGGIGMSGIARMLLSEGKTISGSDRVKTSVTQSLDAAGARIDYEQAGRLPESADLVVISAAIKQDNPELVEARRRDINVQKYARVLGRLMAERRGIAVSGTHGKTTTTAMIATILQEAGLDPSFVVGAAVGPLGGSSHAGRGDLFVVEACEYDRSFHNLRPACAVINNVEEDHLDYYTNGIDEIVDSFATFASQVKPDGLLIVNRADANAVDAADAASCAVETFALNDLDADWTACGMEPVAGCYRFEVIYRGEDLGTFALGIPGSHNVANALAALACCRWAGVDVRDATEVLAGFHGADRRFQLVGNPGGVTVIDDYAHHPTEIRETLKGASDFFEARRIFVVFQPHQHSRTRFLLKDFPPSTSCATPRPSASG